MPWKMKTKASWSAMKTKNVQNSWKQTCKIEKK